jgi:hypothetical protein
MHLKPARDDINSNSHARETSVFGASRERKGRKHYQSTTCWILGANSSAWRGERPQKHKASISVSARESTSGELQIGEKEARASDLPRRERDARGVGEAGQVRRLQLSRCRPRRGSYIGGGGGEEMAPGQQPLAPPQAEAGNGGGEHVCLPPAKDCVGTGRWTSRRGSESGRSLRFWCFLDRFWVLVGWAWVVSWTFVWADCRETWAVHDGKRIQLVSI